MGFASEWLQSGPVYPELIKEAPDKRTGIIVVVPSFDEPAVIKLLESLAACKRPDCSAEVIIVVNAPVHADEKCLENNRITINKAKEWQKNANPFFRLYLLNFEKPVIKGWGVGLARKTGMDEALRRFDRIGREEGIIACMDADCTVAANYFHALEDALLNHSGRKACSIYFEHPLTAEKHPREVLNAALQYEMHLRFYFQSLKYTGFPYVFHTVGSALAVKALPYMKAGGMNRRQAGEDFYFVQKLVAAGGYFSLNSTTVFPSPRISGRVPFGTGAAIGKMINTRQKELLTYNPKSFADLKTFFQMAERFYSVEDDQVEMLYNSFPLSVRTFVSYDEWKTKLNEVKANTSGLPAFRKRFFEWFNMFRIVKYLNYVHTDQFIKVPVYDASVELLKQTGLALFEGDAESLLFFLRKLEKAE
jgi:Glycosyl transferase family group 2